MLIAIMSDAFDQATESREVKARLTKIKIMSDYIHLINLNDDKDEEEDDDDADDEEKEVISKPADANKSGIIGHLKRSSSLFTKSTEGNNDKKINAMESMAVSQMMN